MPLLLTVIAVFLGLKYLTVRNAEMWASDYLYLDGWASACSGLSEEDTEAYVESLTQQISNDTGLLKRAERDTAKFLNSYYNRKVVQMLIAFARTGEGQLPPGVPDNFLNVLSFYRELDAPNIINEQPLDLYFSYQAENIVPVLVLILGAIFWGMHFESEIYKCTETAKAGKNYSSTVSIILTVLSLLLLVANEWFDLWRSGLLDRAYIWSSPIQSYNKFSIVQMRCSIGAVFIMCTCSKLLGALILNHATWLIAKYHKNLKTTLVWSILLLITLLFFGKAVENTGIYPMLQIGIVDWQDLIAKNQILLPLNISPLPLGLSITVVTEFTLACICLKFSKK